MIRKFLYLIFISWAVVCQADENLHHHSYWLKLLHYENGKSTFTNRSFFVSKNGFNNPKNELIKNIELLKKNPQQFACRFPARFKWLNEKLHLNISKQICPKLDHFLKNDFHDLSLVFTAQRYNSPASVFGHTFLKIKTNTIDYALNYSAQTNKNDNEFFYIYKGLTGGYQSSYELVPFSYKDYEYGSMEFRDLIEFKLNLNKDEIENIFLHLYEIKDLQQDYYFISRNCSSELIKILDFRNDSSKLTKELNNATIPIEVIYILQKNKLLLNIDQKSSKLKVFLKYTEKLNKNSKKVFFQIIKNKISIDTFINSKKLNEKEKNLIILASIKYYEVLSTSGKFKQKDIYPFTKLINLQIKRKIKEKKFIKKLQKNPISNNIQKLSLGYKYTNKNRYFTLGYRALYTNRFDFFDNMKKNGSVEFFDLNLKIKKNTIDLDYLNIINIESVPVYNEYFPQTTNKITLGAKTIFHQSGHYGFFELSLGYNYKLFENGYYKTDIGSGVYIKQNTFLSFDLQNSFEFFHKYGVSILKHHYKHFDNSHKIIKLTNENYFKLQNSKSVSLSFGQSKESSYKNNFFTMGYHIGF